MKPTSFLGIVRLSTHWITNLLLSNYEQQLDAIVHIKGFEMDVNFNYCSINSYISYFFYQRTYTFRCANSSTSEMIKISPPKPRKARQKKAAAAAQERRRSSGGQDPKIMQVWSCRDEAVPLSEILEVDRNQVRFIQLGCRK